MDLELLILLGTLAGTSLVVLVATQRRQRSADEARAYLQGFRYILSDEPDAAIAELTRAAQDARTIETYFALGALFRRTGEHERAIRLHQNMLLKPELDPELKRQIQHELALDYQRAGVFERAIETNQAILEASPDDPAALERLREIHEDRRDFARAAEVQGRLVEVASGSRKILAHVLAEAALAEAEPDLASRFAARAVEVEPESAHAALARGLVEWKAGRPEAARSSLKRACELDPEWSARAGETLVQALGAGEAEAFFRARLERADHPATRVALARPLRTSGKIDEAISHLRRALEMDPRYAEARVQLGTALLESSMGDAARRELESLLGALGRQEHGFRCRACGNGYSEPQFRCSACRAWDTVERRPR